MTTADSFDHLLDFTLRARAGDAPSGFEQRLLANLANSRPVPFLRAEAGAQLFSTADRVNSRRSTRSLWTAIAAHAAAFALVFALTLGHVPLSAPVRNAALTALDVPPPPPLAPKLSAAGGGGGQTGPAPVTVGHLPKLAAEPLLPPKAPPLLAPRLAVEPAVNVQPDLKMADNRMPDLGAPSSSLKGSSLGNGRGFGIGSGNGNGVGPGSGGNTGGGVMHVGGSILPPRLLNEVDAEFSEEARKAKFSGDVMVYLWVDEHGNPSHIQVARGIGMGLDEKAVEAVRQYRFKPAMLQGKPVKVDLYVYVNFQIF
jgi:protein TonB